MRSELVYSLQQVHPTDHSPEPRRRLGYVSVDLPHKIHKIHTRELRLLHVLQTGVADRVSAIRARLPSDVSVENPAVFPPENPQNPPGEDPQPPLSENVAFLLENVTLRRRRRVFFRGLFAAEVFFQREVLLGRRGVPEGRGVRGGRGVF